MRIPFGSNAIVTAVVVCAAAGCGSPAAPSSTNAPPVIDSLTVASDRVEADQAIGVTATVRDAETPLDQLRYTWSASPQPGLFAGPQANVTWVPPKGQRTPDLYTLTLTVNENFTAAGQSKVNTVSKSTTVHYNDSPAEVAFLARDFLVTKFGNVNVAPVDAVSNFSDSTLRQPDESICSIEKAKEFDDVKNNRANFKIIGAGFTPQTIALNTGRTFGSVDGPCQFEDVPNDGPNAGHREFVSGTCHLTTVYENFRWLLCASNFFNGETTLESLKGRVPGPRASSIR
jgi:hypothetical protein